MVRVKSCEEDGSRGHDYCKLCNIYVYNDNMKVFVVEVLHVCSFVDHLKAYHVIPTHKYIIVHYNDLYSHGVLHIKEKNSRLYVVESSYFCNYE